VLWHVRCDPQQTILGCDMAPISGNQNDDGLKRAVHYDFAD
jgi:hypothetical protein